MWIIVLIVIAIISFIGYKYYNKAKEKIEKEERIRKEKERKALEESKRKKFEVLTENEKQKLSAHGKDVLSATINAFNKALKGDTDAMVFMAITYQSKIRNEHKAFYWMEKASNLGNSEGTYWLGEFYVSGYGVTANKTRGLGYIIIAAKKGNKNAIKGLKENGMSIAEMRSSGIPV